MGSAGCALPYTYAPFLPLAPMSDIRRVLTGITTTGAPHLGNYVGAIRPAIAASRDPAVESFYFLADYHALVKCQDPARVQRSTLEIAASWLACGLDPERVYFYRQSDIPEIPELTWLLTCVTGKGLLNRAHAYKATTDANRAAGEDADAGVTAGLYLYPVLMAADILLFNADDVPVGRDQVQHIEIARDIAARFNHIYGVDHFTLPVAVVDEGSAVLPGLDGRKMSKSYDNTIPLWLPGPELRKAIGGIVTNSLAPGEPKDPDESHLFAIYRAFASIQESEAMQRALRAGMGWGDAKQIVYERLERELAPARARYQSLVVSPAKIEATLQLGAERARARAGAFLRELRAAVGLRPLVDVPATIGDAPRKAGREEDDRDGAATTRPPRLVSYRERDGKFYFKLVADDGALLLQSAGFDSPKVAGEIMARIRRGEAVVHDSTGEVAFADGTWIAEVAGELEREHLCLALAALARSTDEA